MSDDCPSIQAESLHYQGDYCVNVILAHINWLLPNLGNRIDYTYFTRPLHFVKAWVHQTHISTLHHVRTLYANE